MEAALQPEYVLDSVDDVRFARTALAADVLEVLLPIFFL
jgi:hypothetical protein